MVTWANGRENFRFHVHWFHIDDNHVKNRFTSSIVLDYLAEFVIKTDIMDSEIIQISKYNKSKLWYIVQSRSDEAIKCSMCSSWCNDCGVEYTTHTAIDDICCGSLKGLNFTHKFSRMSATLIQVKGYNGTCSLMYNATPPPWRMVQHLENKLYPSIRNNSSGMWGVNQVSEIAAKSTWFFIKMAWNSSTLFTRDLGFVIKNVCSIAWLYGLLCSTLTLIRLGSGLSTFLNLTNCGLMRSSLLPTTVLILHKIFLPALHPLFLVGICATPSLFKIFLNQGLSGGVDCLSFFRNPIE